MESELSMPVGSGDDERSLPWLIRQSEQSLELCHDYRFLRVIGFPLVAIGCAFGVGVWLIPGVDLGEAWPMLAVGSLIGSAFALMGLHLSFNRVWFIADKANDRLLHRSGFGPFQRTKGYRLSDIREIRAAAVSGAGSGGTDYTLMLVFPSQPLRVANFVDPAPIVQEATRWSQFLDKPLDNRLGPVA